MARKQYAGAYSRGKRHDTRKGHVRHKRTVRRTKHRVRRVR